LSLKLPDRRWDPWNLLFNGYNVCCFRGKEAGTWTWSLLSPTRLEVQNEWSYTSTYPYAFMACI